MESNKSDPVGLPTLFVRIRIMAVKIPAIDWAINLGRGERFFKSSHKPISPSKSAGPSTEVASQKVVEVKLEIKDAEYETANTPIIIATPPK
jgi:hypothetical protein